MKYASTGVSIEGGESVLKLQTDPEVVLHVACAIMEGETYPQIEASFREAEVRISENEAAFATIYVIRFLTQRLRARPEEVADFCAESGLPVPRDEVLNIARNYQQENESLG